MDNNFIFELAEANANMSDIERLTNLFHCVTQTLEFDIEGSVVELGCNQGLTSVFFRIILDSFNSPKQLHVYDSFQGMPMPTERDAYLKKGDCAATEKELIDNFLGRGLSLPHIHKGWFEETLPHRLPPSISFAYLDSDFYDPVFYSLQCIYPRLSKGAIVVIDDYCDLKINPRACPNLPGVKAACDVFFADKREKIHVLIGSNDLSFGYFRKK